MIEFTTAVILVMSSFYGGSATSSDKIVPEPLINKVETKKVIALTKEEVENRAKVVFKEDPILLEIAMCESSFRQYGPDGLVLRGKVNSDDVGLMQINEKYHAQKALELGFDLKSPEGNIQYAKWLYDKEGSQPWIASSNCWKQTEAYKESKVLAVK